MVKAIVIIFALLCNALWVGAETVSLIGRVKKNNEGIGLSDVKISLRNYTNISTTTGADGSFSLNGSIAVLFNSPQAIAPSQFFIEKNGIVFSTAFPSAVGGADIFSCNGKKIASIRFNDLKAGKHYKPLPKLDPGLNIVRFTIGAESCTRQIVCLGGDLILKNEISGLNNSGNLGMAKKSALGVVDTLVAEKNGYTTKKTAIASYSQKDIVITLDTGVVDTVGPFIINAVAIERIAPGPGIDTFYVVFSEEVPISSLFGNALLLSHNGDQSNCTVLSASDQGNNSFKLVTAMTINPQFGDSLRIDPVGPITDKFGNHAQALNRPVLLKIRAQGAIQDNPRNRKVFMYVFPIPKN